MPNRKDTRDTSPLSATTNNKINLIVPTINTETLVDNIGLNQEITFRENLSSRDDRPDSKGQVTCPASDVLSENLVSSGRYFGRRTVSVNPEKQRCAQKRLNEHQDHWLKSIGYFHKKRVTDEGGVLGRSLIASQGNNRPKELTEQDSYLELEQIYARQKGHTERHKRRNFCQSVNSRTQRADQMGSR